MFLSNISKGIPSIQQILIRTKFLTLNEIESSLMCLNSTNSHLYSLKQSLIYQIKWILKNSIPLK